MVTLQFRQIYVPPGQRVLLHDVSWQEFESILQELEEHRAFRLAYNQGILEIRMPLPEHEIEKELIGDMVKILLEKLAIDCECFGSTIFEKENTNSGIEPDQCFYIQNYQVMHGKRRINLSVDPPPDLAIEVNATSETQLSAYEALQVPELWRYENNNLSINILQNKKYVASSHSSIFSDFPISELINKLIPQSMVIGSSPTLRIFSHRIKQLIGNK